MKTNIFISYSRKDSGIAQQLMKEFESIDLDVWVDWEDIPPAVGWLDQILQGIEQVDAFIFLVSPDSIASEICNVELQHAYKNAKRIIPIVVRNVDPKTTVDIIRDLNWIFIHEEGNFAAGLEKIKLAIDLDVEWLQEHRRLQVRALDWDRRKDPSLLLRGSDLRNAARMIADKGDKDPKPSDLQNLYISLSSRSERFRRFQMITAAMAGLIMVLLSIVAITQRQSALTFADTAQKQTVLAKESESLAIENARAALIAKASAEKNAVIAQAQRSAARAQIFQSRTGGLFTSTLFAIDSFQRNPSAEAEEILRKNISLLPIPVSEIDHGAAVLSLAVSPDGRSFVSTSADCTACLTLFEDGKNLFCLNSAGSVLDAAFSPDGKLLVTSDASGNVLIFDASNGEMLKKIEYGVSVRDVNISPDGKLLAIARDDGRITLIKLSNYEFAGEFSVTGNLRVTSFSPNGSLFAAGSDVGSITLWNLNSSKIVSLAAHKGEVLDIVFSPNSRLLISGGTDNYAVVTNIRTEEEQFRILNEDWVTDVEVSPDGKWFATASNDFRIRIWDTETGAERLRLLQDSKVSEVTFSPNSMWIASTGTDKTVRVWSAASGAEMFQIPLSATGSVLKFNMDGSRLVTGDDDGHVSIWDISTLEINKDFIRFNAFVNSLVINADGSKFAAATSGQVWLLDSGFYENQIAPSDSLILDYGDDTVSNLNFNADGNLLAISTESGHVDLYDVATGKVQTLIQNGVHQNIVFLPDNSSLILASSDGQLQYRSLNSGSGGILWQGASPIYSVAASSSGLVAVGMDDKVVLIPPTETPAVIEIDSPGKNLWTAFDSSGTLLASTTSAGYTSIWQRQEDNFVPLANYSGNAVTYMAFSPSGARLYLGEADQVLVLDSQTGGEINRLRQKGNVTGLAFQPDGSTLLTSSLRTVQFFDLLSTSDLVDENLISSACKRLTVNFSEAEWDIYFDGEEYRLLCESLPVP